jgi:uncharacterized protein YdbL (DUF1318 family)
MRRRIQSAFTGSLHTASSIKEFTMRVSPIFRITLLAAMLSACVTINVYFPAAAAEKAADKIIGDVWGTTGAPLAPVAKPEGGAQSSLDHVGTERMLLATAYDVLDFIVPPAQAQQADLNVATPAVRQITASMEGRHGDLKKFYDAGAIGLTQSGEVELRDLNSVALPERGSVKQLLAQENSDRNNLYREIAKANNHPEWEADIRKTFAQRWIERASPGWYYKDASGSWRQK